MELNIFRKMLSFTFTNDVIFIDGGSTDGSIETAKKMARFLQDKNNMSIKWN